MIHVNKGSEGLEHVQLDDYDDDYISDSLDQSVNVTMSFDVTNTIKIEDGDGAQKEHHKLRNAKHAERKHHIVEQHQQGQGNLYDSSMSDLRPGRPQRHHRRAAGARRGGGLQPHQLSYPPRLPGYNSEVQARSWGTTNPKKQNPQLKGKLQGSSPQVMPIAPEEQAFHLRMSNLSEGPGSSAIQQRL
jgi:hypothetical protein